MRQSPRVQSLAKSCKKLLRYLSLLCLATSSALWKACKKDRNSSTYLIVCAFLLSRLWQISLVIRQLVIVFTTLRTLLPFFLVKFSSFAWVWTSFSALLKNFKNMGRFSLWKISLWEDPVREIFLIALRESFCILSREVYWMRAFLESFF